MHLGLQMGYWQKHPYPGYIELVQEAERLGYRSVWTGEAYGSDALTPLAWVAGHTSKIRLGTSVTQISARTPACTAMTALTLDHISNGRFVMGIGVSGPQVVEGWYGQPFARPLERTREWVEIFRQVIAREGPVAFAGNQYQLPYTGPGAWGLGKPLKSITLPLRSRIPLMIGAEGPKNVEQTIRIADGWFPIFISPYKLNLYGDLLDNLPPDFEIVMPSLSLNINDDLQQALLPVKMTMALYIGGMGAKDRNFHKELIERMGYGDAADEVQRLYLAGDREGAVRAVPDELADEISLSGPLDRVRERLLDWQKTPITELTIGRGDNLQQDIERLRLMAELVL